MIVIGDSNRDAGVQVGGTYVIQGRADQRFQISSSSIQLLESPIPAAAPPAPAPSQKASSDDISGTKRGTIDPPVSKRPEKILNKKKNI